MIEVFVVFTDESEETYKAIDYHHNEGFIHIELEENHKFVSINDSSIKLFRTTIKDG